MAKKIVPPRGMTKMQSAFDCIDYVRSQTDCCAVALSLGKDSIVTLDLIYPKFNRIVCFFMYWVKGLSHIQRWIDWVKVKYPKVEFVEIPHWNLSYILRSGLYCTPNPNIKLIKLADVCKSIRLTYNIEYIFLGMKKSDSMNRNLMIKRFEEQHYVNNFQCYPLADFNQKDILSYMRQKRLPEPVRYGKKASSGLGFDITCFKWMYKYFPEDLLKVYEVFPLARIVLQRELLKDGQLNLDDV